MTIIFMLQIFLICPKRFKRYHIVDVYFSLLLSHLCFICAQFSFVKMLSLIIIVYVFHCVLGEDIAFFDTNSFVSNNILTTHSPSTFIDIYTNHDNLEEVVKNYNKNFNRRRNDRAYTSFVKDNQKRESTENRNDYGYYERIPKYHNRHFEKYSMVNKVEDNLESEFGEIVDQSKHHNINKVHGDPVSTSFVYLQSQKYGSGENYGNDNNKHYIVTRRPNFMTKKPVSNITLNDPNQGDDFKLGTRFSYIQKIPKLTSNFDQIGTDQSNTKSKINDMLKKYLTKLYEQKYNNKQQYVRPSVYKLDLNQDDENLKSKFFDQSLSVLKNKTVNIANKFFSLFTVVQFQNSRCTASGASGNYEGTCYHQTDCTRLNGTAMGNCADGYGVCCVFRYTCNGVSSQNCTYFESPNYPNFYPGDSGVVTPTTMSPTVAPTTQNPSPTPDPRLKALYLNQKWARQSTTNEALTCIMRINKLNSSIQQMRIDFIDLELTGPTNGTCVMERLIISGQNVNNQVPAICGYNTGQHVYVDVSTLSGPLQLSVLSTVVNSKRFKIRICQLASSCSNQNNCLQYYTGVRGTISSFNYDQAAMFSRSTPGYFNNLNYAICIRKEAGYCSITYTNVMAGVEYPFQLRNVNDNGVTTVPAGQAGAGVIDCPDDYITISGIRLCGDKFNDGSVNADFTQNAPVTDTSAGPIIIPVRTDTRITGQGFKLFYTQNPCTST